MLPKVETKEDFEWKGVELFVCAVLQLVLVFLAYRLDRSKHPPLISESAWAIFFGLLFGTALAILSPKEAGKAGLSPDAFFFGLLPPIILEAGFNMKKRGFFANFTTITSLAVVGTLIATFFTGALILWFGEHGYITKLSSAEAYLYGALISAVDPVATLSVFKKCDAPPLLFNLIFGESVLNDGTAIVVFTLFQEFILHDTNEEINLHVGAIIVLKVIGIGIGSVLLAAMVCFASAFLLKADPELQDYPSYEISIVLLSAYLSYVVADIAGLSGIVALFFSGVLMSHYHFYNISAQSATALTHLLTTLAFLAENFIFLYLGVSIVAYSGNFKWDWAFIVISILICLVARAINTFPICALANCGRQNRIPFKYMIVIWFSGLRGAIAFALALNIRTSNSEHAAVMRSSTLFTVMLTTLLFGMGTSPLLRYLELGAPAQSSNGSNDKEDDDAQVEMRQLLVEKDEMYEEQLSPRKQPGTIHNIWEKVDESYLKPIFGGNPRNQTT